MASMLVFSQSVFGAVLAQPSGEGPTALTISGEIVREEDGALEVTAEDGTRVVLNISTETYVVDGESGQPMTLKDRTGDYVTAYYGPIQTRSMPPQSNAVLVICNLTKDTPPPRYGRVEAIDRTDDQVKVTVGGGALIVKIARKTPILPYLTKNIVSIDNIEVGSDLLMWYPFVVSSFPAQATSQKTVILGKAWEEADDAATDAPEAVDTPEAADDAEADDTADEAVSGEGESVILELAAEDMIVAEDGITLVPLRMVGEAFGYAPIWHQDGNYITLEHKSKPGIIYINGAFIDEAGRSYVPQAFAEAAFGLVSESDGGKVVLRLAE
jgi:hypothetical protein